MSPFLLSAILLIMANATAAERVLIDTDCGFFGDDGTTIVMLARSPRAVRIESVTTVSGNVWGQQSAGYVREILRLADSTNPPVILGAELPLVNSAAMAAEQAKRFGPIDFLGAFGTPEPPPATLRGNAVSHLIETVEDHPGQITIAGLGPLTNIAMAIRLRPDIAPKIKRLVLMGGALNVPGNVTPDAEFNFWFDPEAAQTVLRSPIPEKVLFALDVTNKVTFGKKLFDEIVSAGTPVTKRFAEDFGNRYPGFYANPDATVSLWDALVAAWLIDRSLFSKPEPMLLDVNSTFSAQYGKLMPLDKPLAPNATPVQFVSGANSEAILALFRELLQKGT